MSVQFSCAASLTRHSKGCAMVKYLLTTFHTHDEEIETVHLPVVFTTILRLLVVRDTAIQKRGRPDHVMTDVLLEQPFNAPSRPRGVSS